MRKLLVVLLVLAVVVGALIAAATWLVPTEELRARLEREIATRLERETRVGALELQILPLPALQVRDLRIAGETPRLSPLAEIESVRLELAIFPLLVGRLSLASLAIERPRLVVPLDAAGRPILPLDPAKPASQPGAQPASGEAATPVADAGESPGLGGALLAIDAFHVREGSARVGRHQLESIELDGALRSGGRVEVGGSFDLAGVARVPDLEVEIDGLGGPEWTALASARAEGDLGAVARLARIEKGYEGKFDLEVAGLRLVNYAAREGKIRARLHDLDVRVVGATVGGEGMLDADAAGNWKLDLTAADFRFLGSGLKPRGTLLALEGPFPKALREGLAARLILPGNSLDFVADYSGRDISSISVSPVTLALDPLAPMLGRPLGGKVSVPRMRIYVGPPAWLEGRLSLEDVSHPVAATTLSASGDVEVHRTRLVARSLRARVADQPLEASLTFGLARPWFELRLSGAGLDVEALAAGLVQTRDVAGTATLETFVRGRAEGEATLSSLTGNGRIAIAPGRIRGFSILKQTLGELAALPLAFSAIRGKDLSRYEEEEFQSLTADYVVREGRLRTDNLRIVHRNATAELAGDVGLADGALSLGGRLVLAPEVDETLGPAPDAKPRVIPIAGIGGTIAKPRVTLGEDAALAIGAAITGSERIKQRLDEKLGPGAGEAVEGVLDLLRGEKQPDAAP